jgi:F-type H+-transporting ATPase subunit b
MTLLTAAHAAPWTSGLEDVVAHANPNSPLASLGAGGAVTIDLDVTVAAQIVLFVLLFLILKPLLFTPMLKLFEERERRIDGAKNEAKAMYAQADAKMAQYETELAKVKRSAGDERDKLRAAGQRREQEILAKVRTETNAMIDDGRAKIAKDATTIRAELDAVSKTVARELASRVLGREVA